MIEIEEDVLKKLLEQCNIALSNTSVKEKMEVKNHQYSIWQGADGFWRTHLIVDGKRKLIKKKSKDKLIEQLNEHYEKLFLINIEEIFPEWIEYKTAMGVSSATIIKYKSNYKRFLNDKEISQIDIRSITEVDIGNHIRSILTNGEYTYKCIKQFYQMLNGIFNYAIRKHKLENNPCDYVEIKMFQKFCKENYKMPEERILSENELVTLWNKLEEDHIYKPELITPYAVQLAMLTGLRVGELAGLKWEDIDYKKNRIVIMRSEKQDRINNCYYISTTKTNKIRFLPLTDNIKTLLERLHAVEEEYGFLTEYVFSNKNGKIHCSAISSCGRKKTKQAGMKNKSIHALRRTFNSYIKSLGANTFIASSLLGNSIEVNNNYYTYDIGNMDYKASLVTQLESMVTQPEKVTTQKSKVTNFDFPEMTV